MNMRQAVGALSEKGDLQVVLQHQGPGNDPREASAAFAPVPLRIELV